MDIETYRNYCIQKKDVTEGFPFPNLPNVLVFKVAGKMFTATNADTFESISVRCNPNTIDELRENYAALRKHAYFSERHWTMVMMDNTISDKIIYKWIDESYEMAVKKMTRKQRVAFGL